MAPSEVLLIAAAIVAGIAAVLVWPDAGHALARIALALVALALLLA